MCLEYIQSKKKLKYSTVIELYNFGKLRKTHPLTCSLSNYDYVLLILQVVYLAGVMAASLGTSITDPDNYIGTRVHFQFNIMIYFESGAVNGKMLDLPLGGCFSSPCRGGDFNTVEIYPKPSSNPAGLR